MTSSWSHLAKANFAVITVLTLCSCGMGDVKPLPENTFIKGYAEWAYAAYMDSVSSARDLRLMIAEFLDHPSEDSLSRVKQTWLAAREDYGKTEAFRFYGGPVDGFDGPEGRINAWPLDESYIDYVAGAPESGLINQVTVDINRELLVAANERGGEQNISLGYHAIEFLLWGQDHSSDGPGNRSWSDYVSATPNADRRALYLKLTATQLVEDLESVAAQWAPNKDNYRHTFESYDPNEALRLIFTGLGTLARAELAGERLEVALLTLHQEDEHSCFSDNTHRDIVNNIAAIAIIWNGHESGVGLRQLVAMRAPDYLHGLDRALNRVAAAGSSIQPPFDQEILGGQDGRGPERIEVLISSLRDFSRLLANTAGAMEIGPFGMSL